MVRWPFRKPEWPSPMGDFGRCGFAGSWITPAGPGYPCILLAPSASPRPSSSKFRFDHPQIRPKGMIDGWLDQPRQVDIGTCAKTDALRCRAMHGHQGTLALVPCPADRKLSSCTKNRKQCRCRPTKTHGQHWRRATYRTLWCEIATFMMQVDCFGKNGIERGHSLLSHHSH